jgi:hypothetical protein
VFPSNYAKPVAEKGDTFNVLFDLESASVGDLSGKAGDLVEVLEKPGGGWWLGKFLPTGEIGLLPANYIKLADSVVETSPINKASKSVPDGAVKPATSSTSFPVGGVSSSSPSYLYEDTAVVNSVLAFDRLITDGFVVEPVGLSSSGEAVSRDSAVEIECVAMSWVASESGRREIFSSTRDQGCRLRFLPDSRATVTKGLALGLLQLSVGQTALITCDPSTGYGEAGMPPLVKPNSFLVYHIEVKRRINN